MPTHTPTAVPTHTPTAVPTHTRTTVTIDGYVQKGPIIQGSSIMVRELDNSFTPTGRTFFGSIDDNTGQFSVRVALTSPYIELEANGFYFNEVSGALSNVQLRLLSVADLRDSTTVNVNLLTHLERSRVFTLIDSGLSFDTAKAQAQQEVLAAFNITASAIGNSESLDISQPGTGNAILLAISVILQANRSEAQLTELLSTLSTDLRTDGVLSSAVTRQKLIDGMEYVKPRRAGIRSNIFVRYAELGAPADVPNFAAYAFTLDNTAPWVSSSIPDAEANQEIDAVTLTFSELMQHDTLTESTVQLLNDQGSPVVGTISWNDSNTATSITFTPENILIPGAYQMVISSGAKDLAGNGLATQKIIALTHTQTIRNLQIVYSGGSQPILGNITFTATVATGSNVNYSWNFGDGATATGRSTTYNHTAADKYRIVVTATNSTSSITVFTDIFYAGWTERELLISDGSFQMGCSSSNPGGTIPPSELCSNIEQPLHTVTLDTYHIDKYEVTNARYKTCVDAGQCTTPGSAYSGYYWSVPYYDTTTYADHPVININWHQANAFCAWDGKRLPTEAEWEKAARGSSDTREYPWGNDWPDCSKTNYVHFCVGNPSRVDSYPSGASPYGVMDMAGNVLEWVNDWYQGDYYSVSPVSNPRGPITGMLRVLRGGAWGSSWYSTTSVRSAGRSANDPDNWNYLSGFRCARSP